MEELEKGFAEVFTNIFKGYGLTALPCKIVGILYIEPDEMAMEDIAKKTGYSIASISTTMKMLETAGMVQRRTRPGTRKAFFYMDKDLIKLNIRKLRASHDLMIRPVRQNLPPLIKKYKNKAKDDRSRRQLKLMENYLEQVMAFEKIINGWIKDLEKLA
jgi:DNA-binding transcriptional regulator GbsR (MarR family)